MTDLVVPNRPTLVYDADCGFCTRSAHAVGRWVDRRGRVMVLPWQSLDLDAVGLTPQECARAAQFLDDGGAVYAGHRAIARTLRRGAPAWRPVGMLLTAPGVSWLAGRVYAWVARHRHELPGGTPACEMPRR